MSSLSLKYQDFAGWPNALWIQTDALVLILVPQIGGRIMGLRWGQQDLFWVNPDLAGQVVDLHKLSNPGLDKVDLGFLLWGGNKTWLAPQAHWPQNLPFIDLDSGGYEVNVLEESLDQITVQLTSPICRESGMQMMRTVRVTQTGWEITHQITNHNAHSTRWGIWSNTMVRRPAKVLFPLGEHSVYLQGVKTFSNEGDSVTVRSQVVYPQPDLITIHCERPTKFKFGVDSSQGTVLTVFPIDGGQYLGWMSQFSTFLDEPYGHGCTAEVFNASDYGYLEVEIHSPVRTLAPGESLMFSETNRLVPLNHLPVTSGDVAAIKLLGERL